MSVNDTTLYFIYNNTRAFHCTFCIISEGCGQLGILHILVHGQEVVRAASASNGRLLNQYLLLQGKLYFSPLFRSAISSSENSIFVLFTTLG